MHIILVGTKAQLVKMAPVIRAMEEERAPFLFVLTGQHAETMDDLISAFGIRAPDDYLVKSDEADTAPKLLGWLFRAWSAARTKGYFNSEASQKAKTIVVHGDTFSTLLGAVLGKRFGIKVVHVEAGLRSFNVLHPFPEELVRIIVSRWSQVHFAPDSWAMKNLRKSGAQGEIINTDANTLMDSLRFAVSKETEIDESKDYAVVSLHRVENLSKKARFDFIMRQVESMSEKCLLKFVMHPVTRKKLQKSGWRERFERNANIELVERMDYVRFTALLSKARFLVTDGGSNQEEASYLGLPCLLMRRFTERQEGLGGNVVLSRYDVGVIGKFVAQHSTGKGFHCMSQNAIELNQKSSPSNVIASYLRAL